MREITQGSKKKSYGPYLGYIDKLKDPINLLKQSFDSAGKFISNKMSQSKGPYSDTYNPSPYTWNNRYWVQDPPIGKSRF